MGTGTSCHGIAVAHNCDVRDSVEGRVSDHTVRTESESIQPVHEKSHPLTELTDGIEEGEENWNDVEDFQDKLISTLLQERDCFARDINELKMKVQEIWSKLEMEHVVHKAMHAELEHAKTKMKGLQEEKELLMCMTDQLEPCGELRSWMKVDQEEGGERADRT